MRRLALVLLLLGSLAQAQVLPGRGVNLGNALEAPNEGDWGLVLEEAYFDLIRAAGFDTVRLPVKWSAHAEQEAPYTLTPDILARVDEVVGWALARDLTIILDFHHYDEMATEPERHVARWLGIWAQLAEHYADAPETVLFELLNEPNGALTDALWNAYLARALSLVRTTNPARGVIVGPTGWNAVGKLSSLELPADPHLIVTVHYYEPFAFTHQGATWVSPSPPLGTTWEPGASALAPGWADWSWDSSVGYGAGGLEVTYDAAWAGLYLHRDTPLTGATELVFSTDRALDMRILCGPDEAQALTLTAGPGETRVPLGRCGAEAELSDLFLQDASGAAQPPFQLSGPELLGPGGSWPLLMSAEAALQATLNEAASWAAARDLPLFVGEFGAYERADLSSRIRWTRAVRESAEALGAGWAYWEFGAGFGVYDPLSEQWREDLLGALITP